MAWMKKDAADIKGTSNEVETNDLISKDMRARIAKYITTWVPVATVLLAVITLIFMGIMVWRGAYNAAKELLQYVFSALLPLWGTWIGTVLAFYFSKENLDAANKNVQTLVDRLNPQEKLEAMMVKDVMMKYDQLYKQELADDETLDEVKLFDIRKNIDTRNIKRWPIFKNCVYQLILHRSIIDQFLTDQVVAGKTVKALEALKVKDMKNDGNDWIKQVLVDAACFVPEDATLYEAKKKMDESTCCNDVFVTKNGLSTEPVLGWISNVDIVKYGNY